MNEFRADLHCHTTCSDGSLSPQEILLLAKKIGLKGLSITDHDTIDAYASAFEAAQALGIELITGVELSAALNGHSIHVLGYGFASNSKVLKDFCLQHQQRRVERNKAILELLKKNNMPISSEEISAYSPQAIGSIGRPHIAQAMVKKGYVSSHQEAFKNYLAEGKPCYVDGKTFSVQETIDLIHQAKGLAVIAHPHLIKNGTIIRALAKMNFDGIEGYYACYQPPENTRWLNLAKDKNWMVTGGSDFHGDIKAHIALGSSWVNEETFRRLQKNMSEADV